MTSRRTLIGVTVMAAVVLSAIELSPLGAAHGDHWWHLLPGFDLLYGFIGCVAIVMVSKAIGSAWLQRDEHYYDTRRETVDDV